VINFAHFQPFRRAMTAPVLTVSSYRFGPFEAYPESGQLLKSGARVKLQEQPFRLLCLLLENQGQLVTRDTIRDYLWPQNTFVEFDASLRVAVAKLREALRDDSENPRFIETIPKKGYRFLPAVERILNPDRSGTNGAAAAPPDLAASTAALPLGAARPAAFSSNVLRALFIVAVAAGAALFFISRSHVRVSDSVTPTVTRASPPVRRSLAILGFRNLPGHHDEDWLSPAFTEMLGTELGSGGEIRIVSDEDVARAKRELPVGEQDTLAKTTLQKLAANPGADVVLLGAYTSVPAKDGNHIRLDLRLQDTATGETIAQTAVSGNQADLFDLASRAGADLRRTLNLESITPQDTALARASLPSNEAAVHYYAEGRAKQEAYDVASAKDLLTRAVAADPDYPLAHAYLADAWSQLGFKSKAVAEAKRSLELSWKLPPEGRLAVEGSYQMKVPDWPAAARAYAELHRMRPDNLDYGLKLATVQYRSDPIASLATLHELRQLPAPLGDSPRIDFVEASAQMNHNVAAANAAAEQGIAKAEAQRSPTLVAEGYGLLCQRASTSGASAAENITICEKSHRAYLAAGQENNAARTENDMAGIYFTQGDLVRAQKMWTEAATEFRQVGDTMGLAATTNNIGDVLLEQGKLKDAEKLLGSSMPLYQAMGDSSGVAGVISDLALIARERGELTEAEEGYGRARELAEQVGDKSLTALATSGSADVEFDRADFAGARKDYQKAIDLRGETSEAYAAAVLQVALAQVSIKQGHAAEAEAVLRKCREQFHSQSQIEDELSAGTVLIEALLAQGKQADAVAEVVSDTPLMEKSQNRIARMDFMIASTRPLDAAAPGQKDRAKLEKLIADARAEGLVRLELEARLALGEWDKRAGRAASARTELAELEKAARSKGFVRIANQAAALG
jgi:eukaryotic-like serine/threonine-protein kinase